MTVGRRVVIYGVTGSGKSTLARRLGEVLGLRVVEMDAIRHDGGWDTTPFDVMRERVAELLDNAADGWVCDGNYSSVRDVALSRADTVVWLRLPWRVAFARLFRRTLRHVWTGAPLYSPNGPRESWRTSFMSRKSILWWSVHHHRKGVRSIQRAVDDAPHEARVIVLRSPAEVDALLRAIEHRYALAGS